MEKENSRPEQVNDAEKAKSESKRKACKKNTRGDLAVTFVRMKGKEAEERVHQAFKILLKNFFENS